MSSLETKLQYTKIVLGVVGLIFFIKWAIDVIRLLEVIATK